MAAEKVARPQQAAVAAAVQWSWRPVAQTAWETPAGEREAWPQKSWAAGVQEPGPLEAPAAWAVPLAGEPSEPGSAERAAVAAGTAAAAAGDCMADDSVGQDDLGTGSGSRDFQDGRNRYHG
jgi:hypothetical protein